MLSLPMTSATVTRRIPSPLRIFMLLGLACHLPAGQVHFRLLDAQSGQPTPAMVCIRNDAGQVRLPPDGRVLSQPSTTKEFYEGVDFNPDPNWIGPVRKMQGKGNNHDRSYVYDLLPSIPFWKEPVAYQTSGEFNINLPAGPWRIAVEHGMEYIPVTRPFMVATETTVTNTIRLERWIDLPQRGWWSGDVHVHHPSATPAQRQFLLRYAQAADLHVVNLLEMGHHLGTDFKQAGFGKAFRVQAGDYYLVSGQEEPRSTFGHIIGLNITNLVRDLSTYDFYDIAFRRIHEQPGALVGFAHFAWNGCDLPRGFPWYVTTGELDFIELLQFSQINALDYYEYLNLGFRLTAAAGSDTPWGSTIGEVRTYVHTGPAFSIDAWFDGLKQGRTFVSNGPVLEFTVDDQLPGSEVIKNAGETVRIRARVESHPTIGLPDVLTLVGQEGVLKEIRNPGQDSALSFQLERTVSHSQWLVLSTRCDNKAVAHSTPVYIIVDGQPTWCPSRGPAVIQKQLAAIEKIATEFDPAKDPRQQGIHQRLDRAWKFYESLLERMTSWGGANGA